MMPFKSDPKGIDREHEKYCSYCYANGKLVYEGDDVKEFKRLMIENMVANGTSKWKAKMLAYFSGFAPRWKEK